MYKIEQYVRYNSPFYSRKCRVWKECFALYGYDYEIIGDEKGVLFWSNEPSKEDLPLMWRYICSKM